MNTRGQKELPYGKHRALLTDKYFCWLCAQLEGPLPDHISSVHKTERLSGDAQIRDYLRMAKRRKWWIGLTTLAVFLTALVLAIQLPNTHRAETVILVDPQKVPDSYVASTVSSSIADRLSTMQQQVMSPSRLQRIIDEMGLYAELRGQKTTEDIIHIMQGATAIEVVAPSDRRLSAFRIAFHGRDPVMTAKVCNRLAALFIEENLQVRAQQFTGTAEFLQNELQNTKAQLEVKEKELGRIKSTYVLNLPESKQDHLEALTTLRTQLQTNVDRVNRAQQEKVYMQSLMVTSNLTVDLDASGAMGLSASASPLQRLEQQLATLRARYGPNYPEVRKLQSQVEEMKKNSGEVAQQAPAIDEVNRAGRRGSRNPFLEAQLQKLDQEIDDSTKAQAQLRERINFHVSKLDRVPIFEQQISGLMRDYDTLRTHYNGLLDKKLSAEMASELEARQKGERFVILDPAQAPQKPFSPNRKLLALAGLVGGLLAGICLAIMVEMTDQSVRTEDEVARLLGKPILGDIPRISTPRQRGRDLFRALSAVTATVVGSVGLGTLLSFVIGRLL